MNRKTFIYTSLIFAGGLTIGGYYLTRPEPNSNPLSASTDKDEDEVAITPYILIDSSGVTIIAPRAEMGQGIQGTLAVLVAEELDIAISDINVIHGPPSEVYANNILYPSKSTIRRMVNRIKNRVGIETVHANSHPQLTGAQSSTIDGFVKMRKAGAAARAVLIQAAAKKFDVNPELLSTENGNVVLPNDNTIPYTSLIDDAQDIQPPIDPPLKPRAKWKQLGRSQPRVDMVSKCTGTAEFGIDIRLPDMLFATVKLNPHIGAGVKHFDDSKAKAIPGYIKAISRNDGIIVIATNTWYAMQAAKKIEVEWEDAPYPATSAAHRMALLQAIDENKGTQRRNIGDVDTALAKTDVIEGTYHVPYLAHATMEPQNAVACLSDGQLDIWAGSQQPGKAQYVGAEIAGVSRESVNVHVTYMGGGFGRRLESDFISMAVHAAVEMEGTPVKVTWSRESDMTHDAYRPIATGRFRGSVVKGKLDALYLDVCSPSLVSSSARRIYGTVNEVSEFLDTASTMGTIKQPYQITNYRVIAHTSQRLLPVGWYRGVGETQNIFFLDSAIDELSYAAGVDPLKMRLSLLDHEPSRSVLESVAVMSNWNSPLPEGHARGVAFALSSGASTAQVIEVSRKNDWIHIERVFAAIDVGIALDPMNIEAQIRSSVLFGLCGAMHGEITVKNGKVEQTNFNDYQILRMNQVPTIDVKIHESGSKLFGVGESGTPTGPPALGNAIFALTGNRIRKLPFSKSINFV